MGEQLPVVSLFSGAGGLDLAVARADGEPLASGDHGSGLLRVSVATDYNQLALQTLKANFKDAATLTGDIREIPTEQILDTAGLRVSEPVLLVGGPPCTPFSKSGFWLEQKRESRDPNASLLDEYVRVVREARPTAFVLENVQGLTYKTHKAQFDRLLNGLSELGYNPQWKVLLAADYGVPQLRRRVFVVGRRDGKKFEFPEPTHSGWSERDRKIDDTKIPHVSAAQAFADLPRLASASLDEIVDGRYAELAAEVPPGQNYLWHTDRYGGRNHFEWRSRYWTFLLRLDPDRPSTTLQAQPGPWVGPFHWENVRTAAGEERVRRLRVNEMLRLMSFPDDFKIDGSRSDVQRQLGNAVPLELGKAVVRSLMGQLGYIGGKRVARKVVFA
ncbi:DNA cytosine methyltransferase [Mycobacteroides chelonae]|uniref:DNA (cytosine-5-)-methyltransferase n=1 Tax=Mycobacteroides chelonae TaxID=1774 RepID=A0A1S1M4M9_MYCCH|nr:DNA cytosine methyltransferase [Mycobacteroides chelonae]OHU78362.1 DNA (cytosine-5-)-methyltransferase [Mycobacteroides chelonae]QQG86450.1 DNA cytosine methyltransferase [Mycobacteroides chelonae]QQG91267.1 DNA cytosine methyltransferase [Mycobacteroides chelonae]